MGVFSLMRFLPENPPPSNATEPCPKGCQNCIRTTWTAPYEVTSLETALHQVASTFGAYPQEGQNNIDKGGWKIVQGKLDGTTDRLHLEYSSGETGFFARWLNGGEPFIDDVLVKVVNEKNPIQTEIRSSSRMGKSDFGVNKKRLEFLAQQIRSKGWEAPEPEYN